MEPCLRRSDALPGYCDSEPPCSRRSPNRRQSPPVSASFSRRVAESHFRAPNAIAATLYRQRLAPERLFMTFLEIEAMNRQFLEAEEVLVR